MEKIDKIVPTTKTYKMFMEEIDRRIEYFEELWVKELNLKKKNEYYKKIMFYNKIFANTAELFVKSI